MVLTSCLSLPKDDNEEFTTFSSFKSKLLEPSFSSPPRTSEHSLSLLGGLPKDKSIWTELVSVSSPLTPSKQFFTSQEEVPKPQSIWTELVSVAFSNTQTEPFFPDSKPKSEDSGTASSPLFTSSSLPTVGPKPTRRSPAIGIPTPDSSTPLSKSVRPSLLLQICKQSGEGITQLLALTVGLSSNSSSESDNSIVTKVPTWELLWPMGSSPIIKGGTFEADCGTTALLRGTPDSSSFLPTVVFKTQTDPPTLGIPTTDSLTRSFRPGRTFLLLHSLIESTDGITRLLLRATGGDSDSSSESVKSIVNLGLSSDLLL